MIDKLNEHREATCRRQKEAWKETILERLKKEKQNEKGTRSKQDNKIPIVIWGLEASPSYFDVNNNEKKVGDNKLHENYLYNEVNENGNNYGVMLIKKWIKTDFSGEYNYTNKIEVLSNANFNKSPFGRARKIEADGATVPTVPAIHLVYDIFPEWHGLKVSPDLRNACFNEHYMREKIPDFEIHLMLIESIFRWYSNGCKQGTIHFVWLATQQGKVKTTIDDGKGNPVEEENPVAHEKFFQCIKAFRKKVKLYYDQKGFFNGKAAEAELVEFP